MCERETSFARARALSLCGCGCDESGYEGTFKVAENEDTFIVVLLVMRLASAESVGSRLADSAAGGQASNTSNTLALLVLILLIR